MRRRLIPLCGGLGFAVLVAGPMLSYFYGNHSSTARSVMVIEALIVLFVGALTATAIGRPAINWALEDEESGRWACLLLVICLSLLMMTVVSKISGRFTHFHLGVFVLDFLFAGFAGVLWSSRIVGWLLYTHRRYLHSMDESAGNRSSRIGRARPAPRTPTHRTVRGGTPTHS